MMEAIEVKRNQAVIHTLYAMDNGNFRIGTQAPGQTEEMSEEVPECEILNGIFDEGIEFNFVTERVLCQHFNRKFNKEIVTPMLGWW